MDGLLMTDKERKWLESYDELDAITKSHGETIAWIDPKEFIEALFSK